MNNNGHIFLSYRSFEAEFAVQLAADLKNKGINLWMDRLDGGIRVGDDWVQTLQKALNECAAVIAVLSPDYINSKYCRRELKRADTLGRNIYPVLLREIDKQDWPFEIQEKQYIDFHDWRDNYKYHSRLDELVQVLRHQSPSQFGETPDLETQYLTGLIAEMEARRGVIEFIDLSGEVVTQENERPNPNQITGWEPEFGLLVDVKSTAKSETKQIPLSNLREAVEKYPCFVLTGEPGAGKTTTIRKLAVEAARKRIENPRTAPLPLLLHLSTWNTEPTPNDFVCTHWRFASNPIRLLSQGEVLLYLDGLNEIGETAPAKARCLYKLLHSEDAPKKVIITCRKADYETTELNLDLPTVIVNKMDEEHIKLFVLNYLNEVRAKSFLSQILSTTSRGQKNVSQLSHLASNPYLLAALIYIYQNSPEGDLPRNTGQLFRALVRALWAREQRKRTSGWVSFEEMETAFARLAFAMIDKDMSTEVSLDYALKHIDDLTLLRAGQSANLVLIHDKHMRFFHQLIQEYFAAMALLQDTRDVKKLMRIEKWRYVIAAWSGIVSNPELFLRELTFREAYLLTLAGYNVPEELSNLLGSLQPGGDLGSSDPHDLSWIPHVVKDAGKLATPYLMKALQFNDTRNRGHAVYLFGFTGDPTAVPTLIALLSDTTELNIINWMPRICDAAALALEGIGTPEALTAVKQWRNDQNELKESKT